MKSHTSEFKEEIKTLGKQQSVRITYTLNNEQIILTNEDINSATPNYEASLLKSVMKVLELDSNVSIPKGTEIKFEYGLLVNGVYEYLDYGNYIVAKEPEKQEDTLSYKITCYDKMLYSMKDYEHIEVNYPCKIKKFLIELCKKIGLEFKDSTFANQDREFANELFMTINKDGTYSSMGYTYRDVLDQIAETTGGCICMTLDDKVEVRYINELYNKKSVTGNPIYITDSIESELTINKIEGAYKQDKVPSPDYPSEIKTVKDSVEIDIVNKNLFDKNKALRGYELNGTTGKTSSNSLFFTSDYIRVDPNGQYFLRGKHDGTSNCFYDKNKKYLAKVTLTNGLLTVPSNSDIYYLRFNARLTSIDTTMIEKGTEKTDYVEGKSQSITMPVQQEMLEGDYIVDVEHHEWRKVVLDGTENWNLQSINSYGLANFNYKTGQSEVEVKFNVLSNYFKAQTTSIAQTTNEGIFMQWSNEIFIRIKSNKASTIDEFKTFLKSKYDAGNPVIVYYKLIEPVNLELTEEQKAVKNTSINAYEPITNVYASDSLAKLDITYVNSKETIDEEYINDTNVNFGEKYGPINSVVLARSSDSDRVYKKDQTSIDKNGLCELKISENQFMNFNDRSDYLPELADKLFGIEYYLNDFVSTGIMYYDLLDMYNVKIYGKTYNCLMLNDEQNITQGLEENIHTDRPEKSETDYTKADKTDRKLNQTTLMVDKQNQKIEGVISQIGDRSEKTTTITADIDGLNSKVENIADFTKEKTQTENLYLDDIAEGEGYILNFKIYGNTTYFNSKKITICASPYIRGYGADINLLTEDGQELLTEDGQEIIIGEGSYYLRTLEITLDDYLRNVKEGDNEYFDTLEIAQDGTITITRNIEVANDGTLYVLNEPIITKLEEKLVLPSLKTGTYYFIEELAGLTYYANYIIQNDYSDTFLTKLELGTQITQNAEAVRIAWNQISDFIQMMVINDQASLAILNKDNKLLMSLNKEGQHFFNENNEELFGEMGVQKEGDNQYIAFSIEGEYEQTMKDGMAWGIKTKSDNKFYPLFYIKDFQMGPKDSEVGRGSLVLTGCDIILNGFGTGIQTGGVRIEGDPGEIGMYFYDSNDGSKSYLKIIPENSQGTATVNILDKIDFYRNQAGSNSLKLGEGNNYTLLTDEGSLTCSGSGGVLFENSNFNCLSNDVTFGTVNKNINFNVFTQTALFWNDLRAVGNIYASNISSDRRIKENIKNSEVKALDIIKKIQHKQFDKKTDGKHYDIGYIAQEMEKIDPNFVLISPKTDKIEEMYYINELPIIATLSKAIQEQQEEIESMKEIINKQQEQINKILGGK